MMTKGKINIIAFVIVLIGLIIVGLGSIKIVEAKNGVLNAEQSKNYSDDTSYALHNLKSYSEMINGGIDPLQIKKDSYIRANYLKGIKAVIIGLIIIVVGVLVKVFFV